MSETTVTMRRLEALSIMRDGATARAAGRTALDCPYSPNGDADERLRVAAWQRGFTTGGRALAAGGTMSETVADPPGAEPATAERPWHGVLAPEGVVSGDRRKFSPDSLTWRTLPLPLEWQEQTGPGHDGAYVVGRIDTIERTGDGLLSATGVWHDSTEADKAYDLVEGQMLRGLSVELDEDPEAPWVAHFEDDDGNVIDGDEWFWELMEGDDPGPEPIQVVDSGRICAVTLLPVPAFEEAFVANGGSADALAFSLDHAFAVSEQPWGDFTDADYTPEQRKDATLIHLDPAEGQDPLAKELHKLPVYEPGGDLNRAGVHAAASALAGGRGGVDAPDDQIAAAAKTLVGLYNSQLDEEPPEALVSLAGSARSVLVARAGLPVLDHSFFTYPEALRDGPTACHVDDDGRVYGHLAVWGTCHIGIEGACVTPPRSAANYAYFLTGEVDTDLGSEPVGQITMGTGHADPALAMRAAVEHYDDTGTVIADVTVGDDEHGIWYSGRIRPGITGERLAAFVAGGALSGDWRRVGGSLELVAALAVNVPGFPVPRLQVAASGHRQMSLVASGVVGPSNMAWRTGGVDVDSLVAAVLTRMDRRDRVARLTRRVKGDRAQRIARAAAIVKGE